MKHVSWHSYTLLCTLITQVALYALSRSEATARPAGILSLERTLNLAVIYLNREFFEHSLTESSFGAVQVYDLNCELLPLTLLQVPPPTVPLPTSKRWAQPRPPAKPPGQPTYTENKKDTSEWFRL